MQLQTHSCTLADGTDGQIKSILNTSTSGTNGITITVTSFDNSTITLNALSESVTCLFKNSKWYVIGQNGQLTLLILRNNYVYI